MRQLTIYIDSSTEHRLRMAAKSAKMSISKWVAALVRERTETTWPKSVADMAGAWPDLPAAEDLRKRQGSDGQRESM